MGISLVQCVYQQAQSLLALKINIRRGIRKILTDMFHQGMENAKKRADFCITAKGGHLRDNMFHNELVVISMK